MYSIVSIPKPENLPAKRASDTKYPFATMKSGESFVVPYGDMKEGETPEKFRQRVYKSAKEFARKNNRKAGDSGSEWSFTAALMTEDDKSEAKAFVQGDVVVWRD